MKHLFAVLALALAGCTGAAGQCFLNFSPSSAMATAAGGDAIFSVTPTITPCPRTATSNNPDWLTVSFGQSSSGGASTVGYTVKPNTTGAIRTGSISVNTLQFQVTQAANVCMFSMTPAAQSVSVSGGTFTTLVNTTCTWAATANVPWITIANPGTTGPGTLTYMVTANPNLGSRTGIITVGTVQTTVTQFGTQCTFTVSPSTVSIASAGGTAQISVATDATCAWTASSATTWISLTAPTSRIGPGTVGINAAANPAPSPRVGGLIVAGQNAVVNQDAAGIMFTSGSVVNAASFAAGPVAPGEIVTIFGTGLGPTPGVTLQLTVDGQFLTTSLGGTRVLFDGVPAPMIYASSTQVSAIVPYALANAATTQLTIEVQGVRSTAAAMTVRPASPAIFTALSSGTGQGAVLNQDSSVNSAANPANAGSVVQIFATGEGQTAPVGMDGRLAAVPAPVPISQPVTALVGGVAAQVLYAGGAPGLVAGVLQVNVQVPVSVKTSNTVPVVLTIGTASTIAGVTIAVR